MNLPAFMKRQLPGPVDLDDGMRLTLADRLPQAPQLPSEYAPRRPLPRVETFLALPIKEIDAALKSLKDGYEETCARGQKLRDLIMAAHEELLETIKREQDFAQFTAEAFDALQQRYVRAGQPEPVADTSRAEPPASEAEVPS